MMRELFDVHGEPAAPAKVEASYITSFSDLYSVRDLLGVGAYGVVLLVKNKTTLEKSALKIINKDNLSKNALAILKNESCIMKSM
jgi:serine/threonine protein kinase